MARPSARVPRSLAVGAAWAAGGLGAIVGAGAAGVAYAISGAWRPQFDYGFSPFELGVPWEDVAFAAPDGARLAGWWLDRPGSDRVVIICHGHRGGKQDMLGLGSGLWRAGNTVFLFDFRGSGQSGDGVQSLAHHEQGDLEAAIALARRRRPDARLAVIGFSMGGAVTIPVAARTPAVEAVVLDSPFADMRDVVATALRRHHVPPWPVLAASDRVTGLLYGYRYRDVRPVEAIARISPRPLLLIHGADDRIIPVAHARALFEAAGQPKRLVIVPGVDHCGAYFVDRPGYIERVAEFLAEALPGKN
ncbi:alpha/beta hydrolase [Nigerium sp.]|uniref:alpha/beta hydrolase n=1 Tax=Nigerium sp. TaxID=2042655 RepID=UPI003221D333